MTENNNKRPKNLDLLHIRLPIGGVVSILHRVSGVLLVLALPPAFLLLQQSLRSPESFAQVVALLGSLPARTFLFFITILLAHHFLAGVRHLLLDLDVGISRSGGRLGAWLVLVGVAGAVLIVAGCLFL
ncbi:MAG: succinate dehydrogenase, cytochrome b556 subunit [Pseudomonadota bacterium]